MLSIQVTLEEGFNEETQEFEVLDSYELRLEHSLFSISKWESIYEIPFIDTEEKSIEQTMTYIKVMCLDEKVPNGIFSHLTTDDFEAINNYINAKMTATWFSDKKSTGKSKKVTAEVIYYWMIQLNIPFECQYWHLNRLTTLIQVCNEKNSPAKKTDFRTAAAKRAALNAERKAALNTSG